MPAVYTEPEFLNFLGAKESFLRIQFRQTGGAVRQHYSCTRFLAPIDCEKTPALWGKIDSIEAKCERRFRMSSLKNNSEILALTTEKEIGSLPKNNHVQYC